MKERYLVSGTARRGDGVHVRVVSDAPPAPGATPAIPTLEDAYLDRIASGRRALAA